MKKLVLAVCLLLPLQVLADQCLKKTTAPDYSGFDDFNSVNLSCDNNGNLRTAVGSLPAGSATAANQATQITAEQAIQTSTASVDTKTPAKGSATSANSSPVVIASDQAAVPVSTAASSTGGVSLTRAAALTNTAIAVDASGGQLFGYYVWNPNSTVCYLQVYNVASGSVTVGTTVPTLSFGVPPTGGANLLSALGITLGGTGISVAATTTTGGGTACSTAIDANVYYK